MRPPARQASPSSSPTEDRGALPRSPEDCLGAAATGRLLAALGAVFVLLTIAVAVDFGPSSRLDHAVAQWGYDRTFEKDALVSWWSGVSRWGAPWVLRLALVAAAVVQLWCRRIGLAVWLVLVAAAENVVAPAVKHVLSRPRPEWDNPIAVEHSLSYPSGHSAAAGMFVTAFTLLIVVTVRRKAARRLLVGTVVSIGLLVASSRIFLGVHYLTDVTAGLVLGAAIALLGWWVLVRGAVAWRLPMWVRPDNGQFGQGGR
jgi:undecaprenyl-diphosphatase